MDAASLPADVQDVEQSLNQFALDLYDTISAADSTQPTDEAISPFSIAAALAMTYAGASGETASQLASALHIDLPPDRFHAAMGAILNDILPTASDTTTQLEIANALWGQDGFPFLDSFEQLTHDQYGADFHEADFKHASNDAVKAINDWVKTQTHDMIEKLFDSLSNDTRLVLANALYFKANWAKAFGANATQRTVFHEASGDSLNVSMMHSGGYYNYTETADYQIAELPYQGDRYSMVVLLPKQAGANLTANFSAANLQNWLSALHSTDVSVALPKFKFDTSQSLIDTLKSLGVTDAFDSRTADFSGIDGQPDLYISQAVHKAAVEVDETGTKASAVTGIGVVATSCMCFAPAPTPFYADHPFHFLIRDRETNTILFMGQVQQPTPDNNNGQIAVELPKTDFHTTDRPPDPYDVDGDGQDTPLDVLIVINLLNDQSSHSSPVGQNILSSVSEIRPDVDKDGAVTALDALLVINQLNRQTMQGALPAALAESLLSHFEGESPAAASDQLDSASADTLRTLDDLATPTSDRSAGRRT